MANPARKLAVEYLSERPGSDGKRAVLLRYVITGEAAQNIDQALERALARAKKEGRTVVSSNFRVNPKQRDVEALVLYVKEG